MARPVQVRFEHHRTGTIGIGHTKPRISWLFEGTTKGWHQASYQVAIQWRDGGVDDHSVISPSNSLVPWPFRALEPCERAAVCVRVKGLGCEAYSEWSTYATVETGLVAPQDWTGRLIQINEHASSCHRPVTFSKQVSHASTIASARLYITAHGVYEAQINGRVVGDDVLAPGWTSYNHRLMYQTYDVTSHLEGQSTSLIEVTVAEGWYCGRLGWGKGLENVYGNALGVLANILVVYADNTTEIIATDDTWIWAYGCTLASGIYDGEVHDARELATTPKPVHCQSIPTTVASPDAPPVRRTHLLTPKNIIKAPSGSEILEFGQNFVGRVRVTVDGPSGTRITLRHAEVLEDGELGIRPLRGAKATDVLVLNGRGPMVWEPRFTFHGFRYVQVDGWPEELKLSDFTGVVLHTDMERRGTFACSNGALQKLHDNVVWSMRSNFLSIPTDCPQRDERLGWTGDIAMFADTANFLYDTIGMLSSWLSDLSCEQVEAGGIVPLTIPNVMPGLEKDAHAIWGDVSILLPWAIYKATGDQTVLERQYASMEAWLKAVPRRSNNLWNYTSQWKLGDWLDPLAPPEDPGNTTTDPDFVADAFLVHVTGLMVRITGVLGNLQATKYYQQSYEQLMHEFANCYITPSGRLSPDTQTAYVLATMFGILEDHHRKTAATRLEEMICRQSRFSIATGFAGTPYIGHALTKLNLTGLFYRMLLHRKCPSWLYPVTMGATTIWERWDSMLPSGQINPGEMTSFNHYALGAVADWMHQNILGFKSLEPGLRVIGVEPRPGGRITWASGEVLTPCGICRVVWQILKKAETHEEIFRLKVVVPPNTVAKIRLPNNTEVYECGSGEHVWAVPYESDRSWPPSAYYPPSIEPDDDLPEDDEIPFSEDAAKLENSW